MAIKTRFSVQKKLSRTALAIALSVALYPVSQQVGAGPGRAIDPGSPENGAIVLAQAINPQAAVNAFSQYYSYCDAELLAAYYQGLASAWDAKVWAGEKILSFNYDVWNNDLVPIISPYYNDPNAVPPDVFGCYFEASNYSYNDAQRLACGWQGTHGYMLPVDKAKLTIGVALAARDTNSIMHHFQQPGC